MGAIIAHETCDRWVHLPLYPANETGKLRRWAAFHDLSLIIVQGQVFSDD